MSREATSDSVGKPALLFGLMIASLLCTGPIAQAQVIYDDPTRLGQSFLYLHWNLKGDTTDASISEWVLPISGMIPFAENAELRYYTALAGTNGTGRFDSDLSGLIDTRMHLARSFADDRLLVSLGVNLPTGRKKLDENQRKILRILSAEHFNFPVKTFGEGLGLYGEVLGATAAGEWILGGGVGVLYSGSYEPADDGVSYRPGVRVYFTGSAEIAGGENAANRLNLGGVFLLSAPDEADGREVFRDGAQLDLSASGTRRFGGWLGGMDLRLILRGKDERPTGEDILAVESYATSGSEFRVTLRAARELSARLSGMLDFSGKFYAANGYPKNDLNYEGGVSLYGIGGQISGRLSDRIRAGCGLRKWLGNSEEGGQTEALDLSGWEISQSITMTF